MAGAIGQQHMAASEPQGIASNRPKARWAWIRRVSLRVAVAAVASLAALKVGDLAVGHILGTRERHLLRLAPHAQLVHRSREFDYVFRTNSMGLRGPERSFARAAGVTRVVVLGDSFVAGYGVDERDLLTTYLEQALNESRDPAAQSSSASRRTEVINVGRVGTSTIRELDLYEAIGRRFEPDVVVLAYFLGNDLAEVTQEQTRDEWSRWHPQGSVRRLAWFWCPNLYLELGLWKLSRRQLREFVPRSQAEIADEIRREATARGRDPAEAAGRFYELPETIRTDVSAGRLAAQRVVDACIEPDRLVRSLDPDPADFDFAWRRTRDALDRLKKAVARDGARLVVVAIPAPFQVERRSLEFQRELGYEVHESWLSEGCQTARALAAWARDGEVPFLDLTGPLRESPRGLFFIEDVHFTPAGNSSAARQIARFLGNGILSE
jgi:hypothetical protein